MASKKYYWIKLKSNFFDLETIDWLMSQKNGCEYVVLYQKLCLLTANKNGEMVTEIGEMMIPYDANKISRDTKFSFDTVVVALELFKKIGLIYEQENGILKIPYVDEVVGSETEYARKKREYREKIKHNDVKSLPEKTMSEDNEKTMSEDKKRTMSDKSIEIRDKSIENRDKEIDKEKENKKSIDYQAIVNAYNETCVSLPAIRSLSEARKKAVRARLNSGYTHEDFITLFKKAQESDFLKGKNDRNWNADFDWLIKDANMAKVLEGKYDNKVKTVNGQQNVWKTDYDL